MTTNPIKVSKSIVNANCISDHDLVGVVHKMHVKNYTPRKIFVRDYKNYNKETFRNEIRNVPWINCLNQNNLNNAWNLFKHYLSNIIDKHAPLIER